MDQILTYIIQHPKKIAAAIVAVLFVSFTVFFFTQNSLVLLDVKSAGSLASNEDATIYFDDEENGNIKLNTKKLIIIPNTTSSIDIATKYESTVIEHVAVPVFSQRTVSISPQVSSAKLSSDSGDCAYRSSSRVLSWNCDTLESNTKQVIFNNSYPLDQTVDSLSNLSYQQPYENGFLGLLSEDSLALTYVDASTADYKRTIMPLDGDSPGVFTYDTTVILVDHARPNEFIVLDTNSLQYRYYKDSVTTKLPTIRKLPIDKKSDGVYLFSLHDRKLSAYHGSSVDSQDEHGSTTENKPITPTLTKYDITTAKQEGETRTYNDSVVCNDIYSTDTSFICAKGSRVLVFNSSSTSERFVLDEVSGIEIVGNDIYLAYKSGVYKYNQNDESLQVSFKIPGRDIASVSSNGKTIIASGWFNRLENSQQRITYELTPTKNATYPRIEDKLPISYNENTSITGSDFFDETIYVSLLVPGSEYIYGQPAVSEEEATATFNTLKISSLQLLKDKGIDTSKYDVKFFR